MVISAKEEKHLRRQLRRFAVAISQNPVFDQDTDDPTHMCRWCMHVPAVEGGHAKSCILEEARRILSEALKRKK